ncbi:MAG: hypothetical protein WCY37_05795 [Candidatus Dojkabacteria bacterium]
MISLKILGKSSFLRIVFSDGGKGFNLDELSGTGSGKGTLIEDIEQLTRSDIPTVGKY